MPRISTILPVFLLFCASCTKPEPKEIVRLDDNSSLWPVVDSIAVPFRQAVNEQLPSLDSVECVLGEALANENIKLYGVIIPYNRPVVIRDSAIYIGLNHYLGADSDVYTGFPEYLRRSKTLRRMPIDVVNEYLMYARFKEGLSERKTLLSYMLYAGALYNQTLKALPKGTPESVLLNMTDEEYNWCKENEQRIWLKLIEDNLLYSSDTGIISRLLADSPKNTYINANAPGNTLYYIALKIAQAYERNTTSEALPTPEFINNPQTLVQSKYAPQNATR